MLRSGRTLSVSEMMFKFCSLVSGSSGNASLVYAQGTGLLIDCGLNGKRACAAVAEAGVDASSLRAILITHEHSDHISGAGVLARRLRLPVYATDKTWQAMRDAVGALSDAQIKIVEPGECFSVGPIGVCAFSTPHDAADPVGYSLFFDRLKLSVATDMGHISESAVRALEGSDMVLLESNHDVDMLTNGRYPLFLKRRILGEYGHLSNDCAARLAVHLVKKGTRGILLGHLSTENNLPRIAYDTVAQALTSLGARLGRDVQLAVANRYTLSGIY